MSNQELQIDLDSLKTKRRGNSSGNKEDRDLNKGQKPTTKEPKEPSAIPHQRKPVNNPEQKSNKEEEPNSSAKIISDIRKTIKVAINLGNTRGASDELRLVADNRKLDALLLQEPYSRQGN